MMEKIARVNLDGEKIRALAKVLDDKMSAVDLSDTDRLNEELDVIGGLVLVLLEQAEALRDDIDILAQGYAVELSEG